MANSTSPRALTHAITRQRPNRLVVDLGLVTFIDSTGIGALVAADNAARAVGGRLQVRPSPFVAQQLRNTGLYDNLVAGP